MSLFLTPEDAAKEWRCPLARTMHEKHGAGCDGPACACWRWKPRMASDPEFTSAIKREMNALASEDGTNKPSISFHKQAVDRVMRNPEGFGIEREFGYCGLGGFPS